MSKPENDWDTFHEAVQAAGLTPRRCHAGHWQIRGEQRLVNCWPNTKRGFRFQSPGSPAFTGSVADAIDAAGHNTKPPESDRIPFDADVVQVGIIRRFWRWIWQGETT